MYTQINSKWFDKQAVRPAQRALFVQLLVVWFQIRRECSLSAWLQCYGFHCHRDCPLIYSNESTLVVVGDVAQMVERVLSMHEVPRSMLGISKFFFSSFKLMLSLYCKRLFSTTLV